MPLTVAIQGDGVAACSCARLLQKQGYRLVFAGQPKSSGPSLLLNTATQSLIADVFDVGPDFFAGTHAIRRRVVLWGSQPVMEMPHAGLVVNESALLQKLWPAISSQASEAEFTIYSSSNLSVGREHAFGSRAAHAVRVSIVAGASDACWIESLPLGWLFLIPSGVETGGLLAIGGRPGELLKQSRLIAPVVTSVTGEGGTFAAHPRIIEPHCSPGWLACGSAAMRFDPVCGEGVGNAIREAILASAVVHKLGSESILQEYSTRLLLGFLRHLTACQRFYSSANCSDWWTAELAALERGITWTRERLSALPKPRYRMIDFQLEEISAAAEEMPATLVAG